MFRILSLIAFAAVLTACQDAKTKVLLGGTLIASPNAAPIEDSIVVVTGSTIRSAGPRKDVPVPQDSERLDMQGKWILPSGHEPIAAGEQANLQIYNAAPPNGKPVRTMTAGVWTN